MLAIETLLQKKDIPYKLVALSGLTVSHDDVKKNTADIDVENDCKTIVTEDQYGNNYAFLLRGMMKIDFSKVNKLLGKQVSVIKRDELKQLTGKEAGAICPILLKDIPIYVDTRVFQRNKSFFSSGDHNF